MSLQEIFRKCLRAFELRGSGAWSETGKTAFLESINNSGDERYLGSDNGQTDRLCFSEINQPVDIFRSNWHIAQPGLDSGACIARRHQDFVNFGRLGTLPGQGVLSSSAAYDQYFHCLMPKMPHPGEHHRQAMLIGGGNHLVIAH